MGLLGCLLGWLFGLGLALRVRRLCTCCYLGMYGYLSLSFLLVVCLVVDLCLG